MSLTIEQIKIIEVHIKGLNNNLKILESKVEQFHKNEDTYINYQEDNIPPMMIKSLIIQCEDIAGIMHAIDAQKMRINALTKMKDGVEAITAKEHELLMRMDIFKDEYFIANYPVESKIDVKLCSQEEEQLAYMTLFFKTDKIISNALALLADESKSFELG